MKLMVTKIFLKSLQEFCVVFHTAELSERALHVVKEFITVVAGATVSSWQNIGSTWESQSSVLIPSGRLEKMVAFGKGAATSSWGKYPLQLPQLGQEADIHPQPS